MADLVVILTTCESEQEAERLALLVVERRLAACVNILPRTRSIYRWEGKIQDSVEYLLLIKTTRQRFDALSRELTAAHSYSVPEILALPVGNGSEAYMDWVISETNDSL